MAAAWTQRLDVANDLKGDCQVMPSQSLSHGPARTSAGLSVLVVVLLASCVQKEDREVEKPGAGVAAAPYSEEAEIDSRVQLQPTRVTAGSEVAIRFSEPVDRGAGWAFERRYPTGWRHVYTLIAASGEYSPGTPRWGTPGEVLVDDVGLYGHGPDVVVVPTGAAPGQWRLCHMGGSAQGVFCAELEVVEGRVDPHSRIGGARDCASSISSREAVDGDLSFRLLDPEGSLSTKDVEELRSNDEAVGLIKVVAEVRGSVPVTVVVDEEDRDWAGLAYGMEHVRNPRAAIQFEERESEVTFTPCEGRVTQFNGGIAVTRSGCLHLHVSGAGGDPTVVHVEVGAACP